jgi:hypothetical protein
MRPSANPLLWNSPYLGNPIFPLQPNFWHKT